ncbi:hypothetical protein BLS_004716 [Venturia inaequalis]|uniref:Uncharacterized protein n=1 Tax=Venturia inaequalis TaxID=5025 RepID=A0A8H3UKI8_VENIN|nr:hypothetical protein BLS_004716 [Venturia inaequalis]
MSLSMFQSFLSTASLQAVLSLPQPTPFPILPPVHTFDRRRHGDHRTTRTQTDVVTVSSQDSAVEIAVYETQTVRATMISETTVAAAPDDSTPNYGPTVDSPPAVTQAPLPEAAPTPTNARPMNGAFDWSPGVYASAEPTSTTVVDPDKITDINLDRINKGHHRNRARDGVPTTTRGPVVPRAMKGRPDYIAIAIGAALGINLERARPEATSTARPEATSTREIYETIVSLHFNKRVAGEDISTSTSTTTLSPSPTDQVEPTTSAPLKRDPTLTITDSGTRPTPVDLGLRDDREREVGGGLQERRPKERASTRTVKATDPQATIVSLPGMGGEVDSVPVAEYAYHRMPQGSRQGHGYRKRTEEVGKIPDAEAGGVKTSGTGISSRFFDTKSMASPAVEPKALDSKDVFDSEKHQNASDSDVEVAPGHLQEIEVDVAKAIGETEDYDEDSEHSPYPEVRAVVPEVDDPAIPVNTLRMWIIGIVFTIIGSGINNFFSLRYPSVHIVSLVAELVAYPCGVFLAHTLPLYTLNLGPLGRWCINPDRHFNIKEHALITIMSNVSIGSGAADATNILQAGQKFYNFEMKPGFKIAYNTNPLLSPSWAAINVFAGFVMFFWICVPAIYWTNTWYTGYLPLMDASVYDRFGSKYNVTQILNADGTFNQGLYEKYSPPYLGASFAFVYGTSFAAITSVLVPVYLWHGSDIWQAIRGTQKQDIHSRLMKSYKKTPWWYYATLTVVMVAITIAMVEVYNVGLPVYGVFLALLIPAVYMIPCGIIQGLTNVNANQLNVLSEFIGGYMFQGRPLANMVFKILSTDVVGQGVFFAQDMKLGHYLKVAPRLVFAGQFTATIVGALTQVGVTSWMLSNIEGICESDQSNGFTCPSGRTVFSSSVIWGLIGPARLYSVGSIYSGLLHFFWIGALIPVVTWLLYKKTGKKIFRSINWPLIFVGTYNVPPATGINYSSWALVNFIFNKVLFQRFFAWWTKYNYILAAALDTGTALSGIVIFFCILYPGGKFPDWWGKSFEELLEEIGI